MQTKKLEMASLIFSRLKQLISNFYKIEMREKSALNLQRESRKVYKKFLPLATFYWWLLQLIGWFEFSVKKLCWMFRLNEKHFLRLGRVKEVKKQLPCESSVQFSRSVVSDSLQPHELQHARPPCPSPTPRVHSNSRPLSR